MPRLRALVPSLAVSVLACRAPRPDAGEQRGASQVDEGQAGEAQAGQVGEARAGEARAGEARAGEAPPTEPNTVASKARADRPRLDVHVHLVDDAVDELLAAMAREGIDRAVVMSSPHLDRAHPAADRSQPFSGWREANDRLLALTADHRDRLLPFITLDPAAATSEELERWFEAGARGVKLYHGHRSFHARPLADPAHDAMFSWLAAKHAPVLLHINTFRFEDELGELLAAYPELELVCPHLCGSRTDIDRLERILAAHPRLLVDTSHGPGQPGIDGFLNLEREHERVRALIQASPERFLFGSDLVTVVHPDSPERSRVDWDQQVDANLDLLEAERFHFSRPDASGKGSSWGAFEGLALDDATLDAVLEGNAARWLGLSASPQGSAPAR
ncbi:amidohydrolase family protein [Pseudenhygromyxa sp. WMMC2535]|uniref:amidohydrolase family protein n=1 Tax=Pseudenhygromyxa sp. WMMC2535 TaxID=2712867 RepID=UPI001557020E|nr:amidohydrolase family protein [Pseudenhygromyxa sp. WMMC2535]NVB37567.1 amidohydrolase family protein [Pseudenhygromyxa sp. WMMC2535]